MPTADASSECENPFRHELYAMPIDYEWHDFLGNVGFLCVIGSYFWLQIGRVSGQSPAYSLVNAIGAGLILVSLYHDFNLSAVLVEFFWLIISILGLVLSRRRPADIQAQAGRDT